MDKWGLWIALVVVGSIILYGLITGLMKPDEPTGKAGANQAAPAAPAKGGGGID